MNQKVDYTTLSFIEIRAGLEEAARNILATFGSLDLRQLNWRPDDSSWSVAQCFDHLLAANRLTMQGAAEVLAHARPPAFWERLPFWPGMVGKMLIRSQAPESVRKYKAPPQAQPSASDIAPDVVERLFEQHREMLATLRPLDERQATGTIMTSPFLKAITYSVMDGWRLLLAHDRRHLEQARRVTEMPAFPAATAPARV